MADFHFNFDYRDNEDLMMKAACILGRVRFLVKLHKPVLAFRQVENDSRSLLVPLAQYTARVLQGIANSLYLWWQGLAHGAHTQPPPLSLSPTHRGAGTRSSLGRNAAHSAYLVASLALGNCSLRLCHFVALWPCAFAAASVYSICFFMAALPLRFPEVFKAIRSLAFIFVLIYIYNCSQTFCLLAC